MKKTKKINLPTIDVSKNKKFEKDEHEIVEADENDEINTPFLPKLKDNTLIKLSSVKVSKHRWKDS